MLKARTAVQGKDVVQQYLYRAQGTLFVDSRVDIFFMVIDRLEPSNFQASTSSSVLLLYSSSRHIFDIFESPAFNIQMHLVQGLRVRVWY